MSVRSELELAESVTDLMDDAHELEEHEFILDLDDLAESDAKRPAQHVRPVPPPPPPPRRAELRRTPPAAPPAALRSSRSPSGVFPIADVEQALAAAQASQVNGVTAADAEISRLKAQLRARDAYVVEIERALDEWTGHLAAAGIQTSDDLVNLVGRARGHAFRVAELEAQLKELSAEKAELAAAAAASAVAAVQSGEGQPDNSPLRRVRGIGRRYAKQLEALGIVNVKQIAAWTNADINRVAAQLRIQPSRIKREGWIEQARALNH